MLEIIFYRRLLHFLSGEQETGLSDFVHALSEYMLCLDTNNYYALMLKKKRLETLQKNNQIDAQVLRQEISFVNRWIEESNKEYQAWNYKKDLF